MSIINSLLAIHASREGIDVLRAGNALCKKERTAYGDEVVKSFKALKRFLVFVAIFMLVCAAITVMLIF